MSEDQVSFVIEVACAYDLLDWSGDNWPQPKAVLAGGQTINWDTVRLAGERPTNSTDTMRAYYEHVIKPYADSLNREMP